MSVDEPDIAQINEHTQTLPQDEDNQATAKAEIPKNVWHDTFLGLFTSDPLHHKTHHEHGLPEQADENPQVYMVNKPRLNCFYHWVPFVELKILLNLYRPPSKMARLCK